MLPGSEEAKLIPVKVSSAPKPRMACASLSSGFGDVPYRSSSLLLLPTVSADVLRTFAVRVDLVPSVLGCGSAD